MNADIPSPVIAHSQQALMQFRDLDSPAAKAHALQRVPIAILALIGFGIATWLTLFQLGVLPAIWEPFFGEGSRLILTTVSLACCRVLTRRSARLGISPTRSSVWRAAPLDGERSRGS